MSSEQVGQQPYAPLRSSHLNPFSEPITGKQENSHIMRTAEFLTDLRSNRPARPNGSRPLPNRHTTTSPTCGIEPPARTSSALSRPVCSVKQLNTVESNVPERSASAMSHQRVQPTLSTDVSPIGRPFVKQPDVNIAKRDFSTSTKSSRAAPSATYFERGDRWMEKQEARSLRIALQDMDLQDEQRIHAAAQDEASDLVWEHRNTKAPHRDQYTPYDYKSHLRQGSHARSQSTGRYSAFGTRSDEPHQPTVRSASDGSTSNKSENGANGSRVSSGASNLSQANDKKVQESDSEVFTDQGSSRLKKSVDTSFPIAAVKSFNRRRSGDSNPRQVCGEAGKGPFRNPNDYIYEEPEELTQPKVLTQDTARPAPLRIKDKNPILKVSASRNTPDQFDGAPVEGPKKLSRFEIYRNPPSQSRNPSYLRNALPPTPPDSANASDSDAHKDNPSSKAGVEIRSDDIRAATSMRLKDRSPKLPTPTMVSDRPGRPIVSFDRNYKPRKTILQQEQSPSHPSSHDKSTRTRPTLPNKPSLPASITSAPVIPTISILESPSIKVNDGPPTSSINIPDIPSISVSSSDTPSISICEPDNSTRPLPTPANRFRATNGHRPLPSHSSTAPPFSRWSASSYRATAQCAACALPIAGRIVSAASQRFHPACFNCFQCGELLECVAFYPEPDTFRSARLARINDRLNNEPIPEDEAKHHSEADDGDNGLRFFCHLDFHEKFSPRCRSCKTPIEGEVVVACGGEWHVGHFFCAECGDPFDASTPFVEKDGYAWCVGCHCKRFSGKCAGCKRPITDMVVKALGREWHEGCFCCKVYMRLGLLPRSYKRYWTDLAFSNVAATLRTAGSLPEARVRILCVFNVRRGG